ncbi:hypothetical protein ACQUTG_16535 [Marinobacter sp. DUT-1]
MNIRTTLLQPTNSEIHRCRNSRTVSTIQHFRHGQLCTTFRGVKGPLRLDLQADGLTGSLLKLGHTSHQKRQHCDDKQGNRQANTFLTADCQMCM